MTDRTTVTIRVELEPEVVAYLEVLAKSFPLGEPTTVAGVLQHLAWSAADGCRRPGAWERQWVLQAFGDRFRELLKPDDSCAFFEVPK